MLGGQPDLLGSAIGHALSLIAVRSLPPKIQNAAEPVLRDPTERTGLAYWTLVFAQLAALGVVAVSAARQGWVATLLKPAMAMRS